MGANPRIVTEERWIAWDGVSQRLPKGQVMDVPPGSALERAIGVQYLVPLGGVAARPAAEPVETVKPAKTVEPETAPEPKAATPKPKAAAKDDDNPDGAE